MGNKSKKRKKSSSETNKEGQMDELDSQISEEETSGVLKSNKVVKFDDHYTLMTEMFERLINQMKYDQQQLIEVITSKFDNQIRDLQTENSELKSKLAVLEHRVATTQINMLNNANAKHTMTAPAIAASYMPATRQEQGNNTEHRSEQSKPTYASTLQTNKRPFTRLVKGTGEGKWNLKSAPARKFSVKVFLTRLSPDVEPRNVIQHIKETFDIETQVEKVTTRYPSYSSFMITTTFNNSKTLLDENNAEKWPTNAALRRWYDAKPKTAENELPASDSTQDHG